MTVEIDDNYFQVDKKEVHRNQIIDLTNQTSVLCRSLPIQRVIESFSIEPDIRWEKTKDWKSERRQETSLIEMQFDDVGKLMINAEYVPQNELLYDLKRDQKEQSHNRRSSIFNIAKMSGLGAVASGEGNLTERRARGYSDQTPELSNSLLNYQNNLVRRTSRDEIQQ